MLYPSRRPAHVHLLAVLAVITCLGAGYDRIATAQDEEELQIAAPQRMTLTTKDGVDLNVMWYAGGVARSEKGLVKVDYKKVVPVMILHGWNESSGAFSAIATYLQSLGHAVIVPDLRGHGRSKVTIKTGAGEREKKRDDFNSQDMARMVEFDIVRVKKFLLEKNDEEELNIELLCVIASEEGTIMAANWVLRDWSLVDFINRKQGKDVKGLIMLSPMRMYNGYHWNDTMKQPVFSGLNPAVYTIPTLILVGNKDTKTYSEAKRIYSRLNTSRKRLHQSIAEDERREKHTLYLVERNTELQGWKLLDPRLKLNLHLQIKGFIDYKLASKANEDFYKWRKRSAE